MTNLIDYKFTDYKTEQRYKTIDYFNGLKEQGYNILTPEELKQELLNLGYKIDNGRTFNYYNNLNSEYSYLAKSLYIIDIKTKQSFAHVEQVYTNRENLEKLQKIRRNSAAFDGRRIWDF
jgi:hypothetical protein